MKRLTLIRHAKSSWNNPGLADFERPLNKRGRRDAPRMGRWLASQNTRPERLVSSPAERAAATARVMASELGVDPSEIYFDERIYLAGVWALFDVVRGLDDQIGEACLFGHNPGMTDFCNDLTGAEIENVPTCGVARISLAVERWAEVGQNSGRLIEYCYPKKLKG